MEDVQRAAQAKPVQPAAEVTLDRPARMRQAIAAAMARSKREIPHYYLSTTIDMSRVMAWLTQENLKRTVEDRLVYGVLLLKAVALALRDAPEFNSIWMGGTGDPGSRYSCRSGDFLERRRARGPRTASHGSPEP